MSLVVSGCTGDPVEPETSTSSSSTVDPTPTETPEPTPTETGPTKPARPAAMDQHDAEGAAAAAEYFLELYPYVMTTGDTAEWEAMSHEACESCQGMLDSASLRAQDGDIFEGGETRVVVGETYVQDELTGLFPLDLEVTQDPVQIASRGGEILYAEDQRTFAARAEMGVRDGDWVVFGFAEIPA
ncbi:DUF6318 family protein [Cellulosimicrobium marinum]|uniref:DUF6318 family protein n=1 Tax=Cellulosimicrobium marinum TaxID=1638992 RepID=UPI001E4878D7|nr:DUF6318 family protein [Cellulosimicrobium marinum]MCB7136052.1 DUF6318 family protein [Cellulosimicrobium marinum]